MIDGLAPGTTNFCLELNDLIIFPAICSDLLQMNEGQYTLHQKLRAHLAETTTDSRKILVVGMLLQREAHALWRNAISDAARHINMERVNVCIVNGATDILAYDEGIDRWRDYTGVYAARGGAGRNFSEDCFGSVRVFSTDEITAAISRNGEQCVLGGPVRWQSSPVSRHIWTVQKDYGVGEDGSLTASGCSDRFRFELCRFILRATKSPDGPLISKRPFSKNALDLVAQHAKDNGNPSAEFICRSVLHGAPGDNGEWPDLDADRLSHFPNELETGVRMVGAFVFSGHANWRDASQDKGQIKTPGGINILVWSSPERSITVLEKIDHWKIQTRPAAPLIVFSKASGAMVARAQPSNRRMDITSAPPTPDVKTVDQPKGTNAILVVPLDDLDSCFESDNVAECQSALGAILATKTAELSAMD